MANTLELQMKLKVQEKMLMKQAEREERNSEKERNKAKAALKKGNRDFAQLYAQNSVRSHNLSIQLQQNAAKVSSMVVDLKMAEVQAKMAKSLDSVVKEMEKYVGQMDLQKIAAATLKYDKIRGKVSDTQQIITQPEGSVEAEGAGLLDDLENEIMVEMDEQMPEFPSTEKPDEQHEEVGPSAA